MKIKLNNFSGSFDSIDFTIYRVSGATFCPIVKKTGYRRKELKVQLPQFGKGVIVINSMYYLQYNKEIDFSELPSIYEIDMKIDRFFDRRKDAKRLGLVY